MKAIVVMFDSLNRHMLPPYGCDWTHAPNFRRLVERTVTFDRSYICSMPCMPARRDLHTGRPNFLHRSWGPLEPFDDSVPGMLRENGVSSHLISDHYHYWEAGGGNVSHPVQHMAVFPGAGRRSLDGADFRSVGGGCHWTERVGRGLAPAGPGQPAVHAAEDGSAAGPDVRCGHRLYPQQPRRGGLLLADRDVRPARVVFLPAQLQGSLPGALPGLRRAGT